MQAKRLRSKSDWAAPAGDQVVQISPDKVDELEQLDVEQLKVLWAKHYGKPPPPRACKASTSTIYWASTR